MTHVIKHKANVAKWGSRRYSSKRQTVHVTRVNMFLKVHFYFTELYKRCNVVLTSSQPDLTRGYYRNPERKPVSRWVRLEFHQTWANYAQQQVTINIMKIKKRNINGTFTRS